MKSVISNIMRSVVAVFLLLAAQAVQAAQVENLYTIELAVSDQTTAVRLDAFKQALRDVIVKITGSETALQHPAMQRPLKSPSRYVHQFRYVLRPQESVNEQGEPEQVEQLFLSTTFNQDALETLLRSNNISIWGKERPGTLLLIAFQSDGRAIVVTGDSAPKLVEKISMLAQKRGLPVLFPLMDLEDRQQFSVQDVLNFNQLNLSTVTARYAPDALLVGKVSGRSGEGWHGQWLAQFSNRQFNWQFDAASPEQVFDQAMQYLAQLLASEYALQAGSASEQAVLLTVDRMNQLQDHVRVLSYLKSLDAVAAARLVLIDQDKVTYRLQLRNSSDDLSRLIALGSTLEQLDLPQIDASSDDQSILMNYRLLR